MIVAAYRPEQIKLIAPLALDEQLGVNLACTGQVDLGQQLSLLERFVDAFRDCIIGGGRRHRFDVRNQMGQID